MYVVVSKVIACDSGTPNGYGLKSQLLHFWFSSLLKQESNPLIKVPVKMLFSHIEVCDLIPGSNLTPDSCQYKMLAAVMKAQVIKYFLPPK